MAEALAHRAAVHYLIKLAAASLRQISVQGDLRVVVQGHVAGDLGVVEDIFVSAHRKIKIYY